MPAWRCRGRGAEGMRRQPGKAWAVAALLLVVATGLMGGLIGQAPSAAANGPPDGQQGQGQGEGKADERRPDHAQDGSKDQERGNGPPDDRGDEDQEDTDASDGTDDGADKEPSDQDDGSQASADQQEPSDDQDDGEPTQEHDGSTPEETPSQETDDRQAREEDVEPGQPPRVAPTVTPREPRVGELIQLDAGASDPDGTIATVDWFLPGGGWLTGPSTSHIFHAAGNVTLELVVTDDQGLLTTALLEVHVRPALQPAPAPAHDPSAQEEDEPAWQTGASGDHALEQAGLVAGQDPGPDPVAPEDHRPASSLDGERPLGTLAVVAGLLGAAVALIFRVE